MPDRRQRARCRERVFPMANPSAGLVPGGRWPRTTHQSSTSSMRLRTRSAVMLLVFQIGSSTRWMSGAVYSRHVHVAEHRKGKIRPSVCKNSAAMAGVGPFALDVIEVTSAPRPANVSLRCSASLAACLSAYLRASGSMPSARSWRACRARSRASFMKNPQHEPKPIMRSRPWRSYRKTQLFAPLALICSKQPSDTATVAIAAGFLGALDALCCQHVAPASNACSFSRI